MIGQHYVRTGILTNEGGAFLARLQNMRHTGDYDDFLDWKKEDVEPYIPKVEAFIEKIKRVIYSSALADPVFLHIVGSERHSAFSELQLEPIPLQPVIVILVKAILDRCSCAVPGSVVLYLRQDGIVLHLVGEVSAVEFDFQNGFV